jgi:hypothetical protein
MERNKRLPELSRVIEGRSSVRDLVSSNVSPVLPMNKYGYGFRDRSLKAGSRLPQDKRIVLHPERLNQERSKKLAELDRFIGG